MTVKKTVGKRKKTHHHAKTTHARRKRRVGNAIVQRVTKYKELGQNDLIMILVGSAIGGYAIPKLAEMLPEQVKPYEAYIPLGVGGMMALKMKDRNIKMIGIGIACSGVAPVMKELKLISAPEFVNGMYVNSANPMYINGVSPQLANQINTMAEQAGLYEPETVHIDKNNGSVFMQTSNDKYNKQPKFNF